jgi:hypothetical protein
MRNYLVNATSPRVFSPFSLRRAPGKTAFWGDFLGPRGELFGGEIPLGGHFKLYQFGLG